MKTKQLCSTFINVINYYALKKRVPLTVSFLSTYSCNQKCKYCDWMKQDLSALSTEEALALIESFRKSGVIKLGFAGGESLHRDDIDLLLECSHKSGLITSISSNGRAIPYHIRAIEKYVDVVQISLDGRADIHDRLRGKDSYQRVMESIRLLKDKKVKTITNTVLTKKNLSELEFIINLADKYGHRALFQPIFHYSISESRNVINDLQPTFYEMYHAIEYLVEQKRHFRNIGNSTAFLKYIQNSWENQSKIVCHANQLFCTVDALGYVLPCCFDNRRNENYNAVKWGFEKAFANSIQNSFSECCHGCYCSAYMESNLAFSFQISSCINALNII